MISYRSPETGEVVTHTYLETDENGALLTKGDANMTPDLYFPALTANHVIGKVAYVVPPVLSAAFWQSRSGVMFLGGVLLLGSSLYFLRSVGAPRATTRKVSLYDDTEEEARNVRVIRRNYDV